MPVDGSVGPALEHVVERGPHGAGLQPERVAGQVGDAVGHEEEVATARHLVGGLEALGQLGARGTQQLDVVGHSSVLTCHSSGNSTSWRRSRRYGTPAVPPVPVFNPMMRSTVVTWRSRHWRMTSSRSSSSSASS